MDIEKIISKEANSMTSEERNDILQALTRGSDSEGGSEKHGIGHAASQEGVDQKASLIKELMRMFGISYAEAEEILILHPARSAAISEAKRRSSDNGYELY